MMYATLTLSSQPSFEFTNKVHIYLKYRCVCTLVRIGTPPPNPSPVIFPDNQSRDVCDQTKFNRKPSDPKTSNSRKYSP
jgi:hypothetical protein